MKQYYINTSVGRFLSLGSNTPSKTIAVQSGQKIKMNFDYPELYKG